MERCHSLVGGTASQKAVVGEWLLKATLVALLQLLRHEQTGPSASWGGSSSSLEVFKVTPTAERKVALLAPELSISSYQLQSCQDSTVPMVIKGRGAVFAHVHDDQGIHCTHLSVRK